MSGGLKSIAVGLRYAAAEVGAKTGSATEVLCSGRAVVIEPET